MRALNLVVFLICLVSFTLCNARAITGRTVSRDPAVANTQASSASTASAIIHGLASQVQPCIDAIRTGKDVHNGSTTFLFQQIGVISQSTQQATVQIVQLNGKSAPITADDGGGGLMAGLIALTTTLLLETMAATSSVLDLAEVPQYSPLIASVNKEFADLMSATNDLSASQQKRALHTDQLTGLAGRAIVY